MKKILFTISGIALIVLAFLVSSFLIKSKPAPKKDNKTHNITYVKAQAAKSTTSQSDMSYRGRISAYDNVALAAEVSGKILKGDVRFKTGESFRKGQVLVRIYNDDMQASLKSGKSNLLQTLSKILPDIRIDFKNEFEKWNAFFSAIDPSKPLPELPKMNSDKEKVFMAANNVLSSYYSLQQQEINLKRYTIYAPFNGSFREVKKEIGAVASPGAELATIVHSNLLEIVVPVFPADLKWLKKGDRVTLKGNQDEVATAVVSRISDFIDESMQSVNVYLTYQVTGNAHFLLGEYVDVEFTGTELTGFEIPREALLNNNEVYQLKNGKLHKVQVNILRQLNDSFIISGLSENDIIVTESLASINPVTEYKAR